MKTAKRRSQSDCGRTFGLPHHAKRQRLWQLWCLWWIIASQSPWPGFFWWREPPLIARRILLDEEKSFPQRTTRYNSRSSDLILNLHLDFHQRLRLSSCSARTNSADKRFVTPSREQKLPIRLGPWGKTRRKKKIQSADRPEASDRARRWKIARFGLENNNNRANNRDTMCIYSTWAY